MPEKGGGGSKGSQSYKFHFWNRIYYIRLRELKLSGCQRCFLYCLWKSRDCVFSWTLLNNDGSWNNSEALSGETWQYRMFEALGWNVLDLRGILEGLGTNGRAELGSVQQSHRIPIDGAGFDSSAPSIDLLLLYNFTALIMFCLVPSVFHFHWFCKTFLCCAQFHLHHFLTSKTSSFFDQFTVVGIYILPLLQTTERGHLFLNSDNGKERIYLPNIICLLLCFGTEVLREVHLSKPKCSFVGSLKMGFKKVVVQSTRKIHKTLMYHAQNYK